VSWLERDTLGREIGEVTSSTLCVYDERVADGRAKSFVLVILVPARWEREPVSGRQDVDGYGWEDVEVQEWRCRR
jgi:hypothetical protein